MSSNTAPVFKTREYDEEAGESVTVETPIVAGLGVSYGYGSDSYPCTIRKVSPSGKTVWVSRDGFKASSDNTFAESRKRGLYVPKDEDSPEKWEKFTLRGDGDFRKVGCRNYATLHLGRCFARDPHF